MEGMTSFDPAQHPRETTGRFTAKPDHQPELTLGAGVEDEAARREWAPFVFGLPTPTNRPAVDPWLVRDDVAPGLEAFDEYVDVFVGSIDEGLLSRGVAGETRTNAAQAWIDDANTKADTDPEVAEFRDGLRRGLVALYYEKVQYEGSVFDLDGTELEDAAVRALTAARRKRASTEERRFWRQSLQHATPAEQRGMLVVAAALSGTDQWWGFRDRPRGVMTGDLLDQANA